MTAQTLRTPAAGGLSETIDRATDTASSGTVQDMSIDHGRDQVTGVTEGPGSLVVVAHLKGSSLESMADRVVGLPDGDRRQVAA